MKKILLFVTLFCFAMTGSVLAVSDTQRADLYHFGIMVGDTDGNLRLSDTITRAEAVKMLCVAGSLEVDPDAGLPFPDLPPNHWARSYIAAAKTAGMINGDENGNFNPEMPITNEEIVKMTVCLLGYREMAEALSGYPAGYTTTASRLGVTAGLELDVNTHAIRKNVGVMVAQAMDIPLMKELVDKDTGEIFFAAMDGNAGYPKETLRTNLQ